MNKFKRHTAVLAIILIVLTVMAPVFAAQLEEQQQKLNTIRHQMQEQKSRVRAAQSTINNVAEQLRVIQVDLDSAQDDYNAIQAKREDLEAQIDQDNVVLAAAEKALPERVGILNKRMRDIYEHGQISYLDVLLGAADFGDLTTRMNLLQRVLSQDVSLIAQIKAEREMILQKKAELEHNRQEVLALQQAAIEKKNAIESRKSDRKTVLDSAVNQRDVAEQAYQDLQATSSRIETMLRNRGSQTAIASTGSMIWPASGPITSPFGWRVHPIFGTQRFHSGIDIGAEYGDAIRAADNGVVVFADWMGGYGKAVIIDHGHGISTLYGHQSQLLVSEGQRVNKGDIIGRVGSTGYSTGPHLHFEVRQNGTPVNPVGYLP
jgi:murein DD-endopeptidase MepM/ murein hydrolase activator NlpD